MTFLLFYFHVVTTEDSKQKSKHFYVKIRKKNKIAKKYKEKTITTRVIKNL